MLLGRDQDTVVNARIALNVVFRSPALLMLCSATSSPPPIESLLASALMLKLLIVAHVWSPRRKVVPLAAPAPIFAVGMRLLFPASAHVAASSPPTPTESVMMNSQLARALRYESLRALY